MSENPVMFYVVFNRYWGGLAEYATALKLLADALDLKNFTLVVQVSYDSPELCKILYDCHLQEL